MTDEEIYTYGSFVNEYLEKFAPREIDAERFIDTLGTREYYCATKGFKPTSVLYGSHTTGFVVYFENPETGYFVRCEWEGTVYGTWSYGAGHRDDERDDQGLRKFVVCSNMQEAAYFAARQGVTK